MFVKRPSVRIILAEKMLFVCIVVVVDCYSWHTTQSNISKLINEVNEINLNQIVR